ncbi:hypothetical protein [Burkholderia pyrrocinia]|uniref:hypothetical protein n=1 Tax=Burkholderia pyrrocinia TaxID=60550 RepID=UPI001052C5D7|nr:hypothetical protein [Burkholderia pyrrocinia]TDA47884.1 hypothetical protein EVG18_08445 [Burkholderia pyrrocinia]
MCFLVVHQLVARHVTGRNLRTEHLVESLRLWMMWRRVEPGLLERLDLASKSVTLTAELLRHAPPTDAICRTLDGPRLNFRTKQAREIRRACATYLAAREAQAKPSRVLR